MPRPRKKKEESLLPVPTSVTGLDLTRGHMPLAENPRILDGGNAHPQWVWRNLCDYGYATPKDEYCRTLEGVRLEDLAMKWGINYGSLEWWHKNHHWEAERMRQLGQISEDNWQEEAKALSKLQKREILGQRQRWDMLRTVLETLLAKGTTPDQNSLGERFERDFNLKELKEAAGALQIIDDNIGRTIGLEKIKQERNALATDAGSSSVASPRVRTVRHNYSVEVIEESPIQDAVHHQLPAVTLDNHSSVVSEGVIEESNEHHQ